MAAVIHYWRKNPLHDLLNNNPGVKSELEATCLRVFAPYYAWWLYSAPEYRCEVLDENGRWEDDGGVGDRRYADSPPGDLRPSDLGLD